MGKHTEDSPTWACEGSHEQPKKKIFVCTLDPDNRAPYGDPVFSMGGSPRALHDGLCAFCGGRSRLRRDGTLIAHPRRKSRRQRRTARAA